MTLSLSLFPQVPPSRTALTSAEVNEYITNITWANFQAVKTLLDSVESQLNLLPVTTRSASLPDSANLLDRWVDTSSNDQEKICTSAYDSGEGEAGDWTSMRDSATLAVAQTAVSDAADAKLLNAADYPSAYTQDWLFVNTATGAVSVCIETYDASFLGDRATKFQALVDQSSATAIGSLQAAVDNFSADGVISKIEKRALQGEWTQIQSNKALADGLATTLGLEADADYLALVSSYTVLDGYLNTTLLIFDDLDSDTSLTGAGSTRTEWNTRWGDFYTKMATFSTTVSGSLKTDINNVQSDETITEAEARDYELRWNYEVQNYAQHLSTIDKLDASGSIDKITNAEWLAYDLAYNNMNTYLNTQLDLFNVVAFPYQLTTGSSSATEWKAYWNALSEAERAVSDLVNGTFSTQIDSLADDGTISKGGEKILATQAWGGIYGTDGLDGEYALLTNRANSLISAGNTTLEGPRDSLTLAYTGLKAYLDGLTDFYTTTVDTVVINATWDSTWNLYYTKYAALDKAASDIADTDIGLVSGLVNDEAITAGKEKQELIELFDRITLEKTNMVTRSAVGIGADNTTYVTAYDDLKTFLYGLFVDTGDGALFNNKDLGATSVNRSVWKQKFDTYYEKREELETSIIQNNVTNLNRDSAAIPNMATDGTISSEEKYVAKTYWNVIFGADALPDDDGEHDALSTQATALSVTQSYIDNFDDAFIRLWNFLTDDSHGAPLSETTTLDLFDDMGADATLDAPQQSYWQQYWSEYYNQRDTITQQIQTALQADLDAKLPRDGSLAMLGGLNMGGFIISNMAQAAGTGQAVEFDQMNAAILVETNARTTAIGVHAALTASHGVTEIAGLNEVQTFTNKTHTSPDINTPDIDGGTIDGAIIDGASNSFPDFAVNQATTSLTPASNTTFPSTLAVKTYGDANWGGGGGGGGASGTGSKMHTVTLTDSQTGTNQTWTSPLIGTRIDVTDPEYSNSAFNYEFVINTDGGSSRMAFVTGVISKDAGGEPFVTFSTNTQHVSGITNGMVFDVSSATLSTDLAQTPALVRVETASSPAIDDLVIIRDDTANELCFKMEVTFDTSITDHRTTWVMNGIRQYSGTDIVSSQGVSAIGMEIQSAGSTPQEYACFIGEAQNHAGKTQWDSALVGTRIDITDGAYSASTFNLDIVGHILIEDTQVPFMEVSGTIKKQAGGEPYIVWQGSVDNWSGVGHAAADMVGDTVTLDADYSEIDLSYRSWVGTSFGSEFRISRVHDSDELCFKLSFLASSSRTDVLFGFKVSGTKTYGGTDIVSSNGTEF